MKLPLPLTVVASVAALLSLKPVSHAQIALNTTGTYTQNFDTLPAAGTTSWLNDSTLAGWYAQKALGTLDIVASTGSLTGGALYSFGAAASTERAIGSLGSGTTGSVAWGVVFTNASSDTLTFTDFSYVGEFWRRGATNKIDTLEFDYRIGGIAATDLLAVGGWTAVNVLDFSNPSIAGTGILDGNSASNRAPLTATLNLALAPGQFVTFRWLDIDHAGTDNGLAIDNVSISYETNRGSGLTAVPEPSTYGVFAMCGLAILTVLRRWRAGRE